ncbi:MAG TPA: hemoblobin-interacting domain-containing protein [Candidatus Sulfotelmatobacter sp.]|nr:hemoblobin-interacting domain-containing protein [Candidatus Sulfotelmatobacter sp.]
MRIKSIACIGFALMASLSGLKAGTSVLTAWTFDNLAVNTTNTSPAPSTGIGAASALGMLNAYNNTNSLSNPLIVSAQPGSSTGGPNAWQISGYGAAPYGGDGWSTNAPIGSQGAQFSGNTFGYYRINLSFDVYVPPTSEVNLQVQYTTQGTIWTTATNIILQAGSSAQIENNSTSPNTVIGTYVKLTEGWNNDITVDLSGLSGVDNNPNFAVRIVNASTGSDDVDTGGNVYNNTSGNWTFDNVVIAGTSIDAIADWTFQLYGTGPFATNSGYVENPIPDIDLADGQAVAACIGFDITNFNFGSGVFFSTNAPDVTSQAGDSTPNNPYCWRLRGMPGNGWTTIAPVGTQGAEFDVSTVNYSNVILTFDLYFTSQAEAKMCVLYTTNGWTNSFTADTLGYGADPAYIVTNDVALTGDGDTVDGTYFYQNAGQNWYNDLIVDFTGVPGVDNNPNFGVRIVNASATNDCINYTGGLYNNSSGNARVGNVDFGGQFEGSVPPTITAAANATVDYPFTNTFTDDPTWRANIATVYVNNVPITNSAYNVSIAGQLIFNPSQSAQLQVAGLDSIVIFATNYSTARISQYVSAGAFRKLNVPIGTAGPSASGGTLESNPEITLADQYGNTTTNPYANVVVTATAAGATGWTLGGATVQPEVNGVIQFTNLSATVNGSTAVSGAAVELTATGYTNSANQSTTTNFTLPTFNIGAPPAALVAGNLVSLEIDTLSNNTTFSMIEVKPSSTNSSPVTIVPISASTTNALRQSPAGTTGRLCLSDDGTLLNFAAFLDGSSATPDETLNLFRAAVGMTYTNTVTIGLTYTSTSLGGSQARAAVTIDDVNYFADDKGGLYYGAGDLPSPGELPYPNVDPYNNVVVKSFGGAPYVETQKAVNGELIPVVYYVYYGGFDVGWVPVGNNLTTDPNATDFYLIDGTNVMYTCDQISATEGVINKFSWAPNVNPANPSDEYGWTNSGSWTNNNGVDGMFVTTNGAGGAYIYYTTGAGGTSGNSIIRVTDSAGYNQTINIITTNLIYTTPKGTSMKGLVFAPQPTAYAAEPIPTPELLPAANATTAGTSFNVTLSPDDPLFRANITAITVNGTALPSSAYSTGTAGVITFNQTASSLLQSDGSKTIVFSATGYSTNSVTQVIVGAASQLVVSTQPTAPAADGAALAKQPVVTVEDSAGDIVTASANIVAAPTQTTWTLAGTTNVATSAGVATYSGLSALGGSAVSGATITFTSGTLSKASSSFNIPAPIYSVMHKANIAGGKFAFAFTNATGLTYSVLATNNLLAPVSTWPVVGTTVENPTGSGDYVFTNSVGTNGDLFYILRQNP